MFKDHRRNTIMDGQGHTDGCFHPVKPGVIISVVYEENYASSFEGWDVCYLENESWDKIRNWNILKQKNEFRQINFKNFIKCFSHLSRYYIGECTFT